MLTVGVSSQTNQYDLGINIRINRPTYINFRLHLMADFVILSILKSICHDWQEAVFINGNNTIEQNWP